MESILKNLKFGVNSKNSISVQQGKKRQVSSNKINLSKPLPGQDKDNNQLKTDNSSADNTTPEETPLPLNQEFPDCQVFSNKLQSLKKMITKTINSNKQATKMNKTNKERIDDQSSTENKLQRLHSKYNLILEELFSKLNLQVKSTSNFKETDILPLCSFQDIQLHCNLSTSFSDIIKKHYTYQFPSPIQSCVIPLLYSNNNIIATSSTGSGKTLAYVIPIIAVLEKSKSKSNNKKALVILPTKELVNQVFNEFNVFSSYYTESKVKSKTIKHDLLSSVNSSKEEFRKFIDNQDILIGTPENILLLLSKSQDTQYLLKRVKFLLFDEADKMFERSFNSVVQEILGTILEYERKKLKKVREIFDSEVQEKNKEEGKMVLKGTTNGKKGERNRELAVTSFSEADRSELWNRKSLNHRIVKCFFSATLSTEIYEYLNSQIFDLKRISIGNHSLPCSTVNQIFKYCTNYEGKIIEMTNFLSTKITPPVLVFVDSIEEGKKLFERIRYQIPKINLLHSQMSKEAREGLIKKLRVNDIWVLITSDLIARGIDFKNIKTVINFDCPENYVTYIHRVGRTGRAGNDGISVTYVTDDDRGKLKGLKKILTESEKVECPNWMKKV
mmetsp:Transcript_4584/g.4769  ORF Transcript_4584/g.4769 Transcript_4584/m.4769 type:complete len:615 (+) Transcript_4584:19-1863(+)